MSNAAIAPEDLTTLKRQKKAKSSEFDSRSVDPAQKPTIKMPEIHEPLERDPEIIIHEGDLDMDYADTLAFFEEPLKILIHKSSDGLATKTTDLVANNGVPAEMLFQKGWVPVGYLPRGISIIVKRKTVAQLATAKLETVKTSVVERQNDNPDNYIERTVTHPLAFSILEDRNQRGSEWITKILSAQG